MDPKWAERDALDSIGRVQLDRASGEQYEEG